MNLVTEKDVQCLIAQAIKDMADNDKHVKHAIEYNPATGIVQLVMTDGSLVDVPLGALVTDVLSKVPDKHVITWTDYNPTTNTGYLLMSDGTRVPVDLSAVIADAIASIVIPKADGLDCEAVGKLPLRQYREGDSIMVHGVDGVCSRVVAKPGVFSDVRVGVVSGKGSLYTGDTTDVITTVQNLAPGEATLRVVLSNPPGNITIDATRIGKSHTSVGVQKESETSYLISKLGKGQSVTLTRSVTPKAQGNYGFSASLTVADGSLFDFSTVDDYSGTFVFVSDISSGHTSIDCPLIRVFPPAGAGEIPVRPITSPASAWYPGYQVNIGHTRYYSNDKTKQEWIMLLCEGGKPVSLRVTDATTAKPSTDMFNATRLLYNSTERCIATSFGKAILGGHNSAVSNYQPNTAGISMDVANGRLTFPAPPTGKAYRFVVELYAGANCIPQYITGIVANKESLIPTPGAYAIEPTEGISAEIVDDYEIPLSLGGDVYDAKGKLGTATDQRNFRIAKLTIPHGKAYSGRVKLAAVASELSTVGNVSVTPAGFTVEEGQLYNVVVSANAAAKDSVQKVANFITVITQD